jgi:DNA-binding transcriptional MerR regulator/methylmalonyl-CoA mutase cobalamin-binding subunit
MSIAAVERDCGLPKDTLRVWERRYGFPKPLRDHRDERLYPADQVATLRLLRRLVDAGHRPGKVVGRSDEDLSELLRHVGAPPSEVVGAEARQVLTLLGAYDAAGLREMLNAIVQRAGLGAFAAEIGPGLAEAVGAAWARGDLEIHQEHLFTEQFTTVLRSAINAAQGAGLPRRRPRVLFSTFPQEPHALGLLMAESMFTIEGCLGISLGVQTPIPEIAAGARAHKADILALSFSSMIPAPQALSGLNELRALVPSNMEIWAGGACQGLRPKPGFQVFRELSAIAPAVRAWRSRAPESSG